MKPTGEKNATPVPFLYLVAGPAITIAQLTLTANRAFGNFRAFGGPIPPAEIAAPYSQSESPFGISALCYASNRAFAVSTVPVSGGRSPQESQSIEGIFPPCSICK